jgi:hypothetical protein
MRSLYCKGMWGKTNVRYKYYIILYLLNIKLLKSKKFFIPSNALAFKEFLRPQSVLRNFTTSWRMSVTYTSRGVMKMLRCALYKKNTVFAVPKRGENNKRR